MFRKTAVFGYFGQIRPFPVAEYGQNCKKAHLQAKTFHMSLLQGLYDHSSQKKNSLEKPMFRKTAIFGHFGQIRPFPVVEYGQNCQKAHLQAKTFHMSLLPGLYDHLLQRNSLETPMFRKTAIFGHFCQIRPFPVIESGQNCQKAHLLAKTFHMSLFPGLYDHPLQRYSLENHMFRKTAVFGHFGRIRHI